MYTHRKALNLLQYLLSQRPQDISQALQLGCLEPCVDSLHLGEEAVAAAKKQPSPDGFSLEEVRRCALTAEQQWQQG